MNISPYNSYFLPFFPSCLWWGCFLFPEWALVVNFFPTSGSEILLDSKRWRLNTGSYTGQACVLILNFTPTCLYFWEKIKRNWLDINFNFNRFSFSILNLLLTSIPCLMTNEGFLNIIFCVCSCCLITSCAQCPGRPAEGDSSPGSGVTGRCEPPRMGAENWSQVLQKSSQGV